MTTDGAAHAVRSMAESQCDNAVRSGHWVGNIVQDILKAFTLRCVWDASESCKHYDIIVLNLATVDAQGVIISFLRRPCKHVLCPLGRNEWFIMVSKWEVVIHIGVGSDVVCSTTIGNARASMRGTDNRRFHA